MGHNHIAKREEKKPYNLLISDTTEDLFATPCNGRMFSAFFSANKKTTKSLHVTKWQQDKTLRSDAAHFLKSAQYAAKKVFPIECGKHVNCVDTHQSNGSRGGVSRFIELARLKNGQAITFQQGSSIEMLLSKIYGRRMFRPDQNGNHAIAVHLFQQEAFRCHYMTQL